MLLSLACIQQVGCTVALLQCRNPLVFSVGQNDCNFLLCLITEHAFEKFGRAIARLPTPWLRACSTGCIF